jgi:hypothetical protein
MLIYPNPVQTDIQDIEGSVWSMEFKVFFHLHEVHSQKDLALKQIESYLIVSTTRQSREFNFGIIIEA